jgi:hypothetical protein
MQASIEALRAEVRDRAPASGDGAAGAYRPA